MTDATVDGAMGDGAMGDGATGDKPLAWGVEPEMSPVDTVMWRGDSDRRLRSTISMVPSVEPESTTTISAQKSRLSRQPPISSASSLQTMAAVMGLPNLAVIFARSSRLPPALRP